MTCAVITTRWKSHIVRLPNPVFFVGMHGPREFSPILGGGGEKDRNFARITFVADIIYGLGMFKCENETCVNVNV